MEITETGIVLKRFFPFKQKTSVLTKEHGKITIFSSKKTMCQKLWPGMIFTFEMNNRSENFILADKIEIVESNTPISHNNIITLHQILEICYYSAPLHAPLQELFYLVATIIIVFQNEKFHEKNLGKIKYLFLLKLLLVLGVYPANNLELFSKVIKNLSIASIDFSDEQKVEFLMRYLETNIESLKIIKKVVIDCLKNHPCYNAFKTLKTQRLV